jgi:DNA-binding transcriptional MerR regulator
MKPSHPESKSYSLDELAAAAGLSRRTVRYYIQIGLLGRAEGETRAARYSATHLEQLVAIRRWTEEGISLDRVRDLLARPASEAEARASARPAGVVEVWSHLVVADGLEVTLEAGRAGLTPEQAREFFRAVTTAFAEIKKDGSHDKPGNPPRQRH